MRVDQPVAIQLADYTAPAFSVSRVELEFDLEPEFTLVTATQYLKRCDGGNDDLVLHGEELGLNSIRVNGRELREDQFTLTDELLTLSDLPDEFTLTIQNTINPAANTRLEGLYRSSTMYCTQCEAEGFRRITYFMDRPDVMTTYKVTIRADKETNPVLLSNGNNIENGDLEGGRHYAIWEDPHAKPSYLFALVAGDLAKVEDNFTTKSGQDVTLRIFVEHGNETRCDYAMDSLKRSMRWDETRFDLEYDLNIFNIVAVSDFNMGAMENKSLNVFNDKYILADEKTGTDTDFDLIEGIVAHEYFHNWTGNRVTCRDWFQLSLKEGLTVFRDQEFSGDQRSHAVKRIEDVRMLRARQFPEDAGPLSHPVRPESYIEINNFYTATVYEKGAEVIRMMHTLLGEENFQKGMKLYFERHDGQAVTCDDFAAAMQDASGVDLAHFKLWYSQSGTPNVDVMSAEYDQETQRFSLTLRQETKPTAGQATKQALHIPLRVGLLGEAGEDQKCYFDGVEASEHLLHLKEEEQTFVFENVVTKPVLSLNRGFTAPVHLKTGQSQAEMAFLMGNDHDSFNRWEAGQQYAAELLTKMVAEYQAGKDFSIDNDFVAAMGHIARNEDLEPAFKACALKLPSEEFVSEQMDMIDVDAIHAAREALRVAVATAHRSVFEEIYDHSTVHGAFEPTAEQAGLRDLRNTALAYMAAADANKAPALLKAHYEAADNMTDAVAGMRLITDYPGEMKKTVFDHFHDIWKDNAIVMDKWLGAQAISSHPDVLSDVKALMDHPVFNFNNPNRLRALIGSFCIGNMVRFHTADGAGYDFLADIIIRLDKMNPQVSARLAGPLGQWKRFDEGRQIKMKSALQRVADVDGLSRDVFEVVNKSLV
ncbi:aminopeptidase N [Curvivirga sp.]|uniref:aminopeptidase N n=1 Tax=Curvivirga sp. TaxID=2856848 RepID=UPI003B590D9D